MKSVMLYAFILLITISCTNNGTDISIAPVPPPDKVLVEYTEWQASAPQAKQRGTFTYNEEDQFVRYELALQASDDWFTTIRVEYIYENGLLTTNETYIRPLGTEEWFNTGLTEYSHNEKGLIVEAKVQSVNERTGEVGIAVYTYTYNEYDFISEISIDGEKQTQYIYDGKGNVTESRSYLEGEVLLVAVYEHEDSWNPFYNLPLNSGVNIIGVRDRFSYHNSIYYENAQPGLSPASYATGEIQKDDDGFPVRKEWTFWNATDPDVKSTNVTEYRYR